MSNISESLQRKAPAKRGAQKQIKLRLQNIDFWSAMKIAAIAGLVLAIVQLVATLVVWLMLEVLGVFDRVDALLQDILAQPQFTLMDFMGLPNVVLFSLVIGLLNFIVITVLGALAALIYNRSVRLTGGLLVSFTNQ